jgi:predicted transcriptional regulator
VAFQHLGDAKKRSPPTPHPRQKANRTVHTIGFSAIAISARILPQWDHELTQVMEATGQTRSQVMEDAIAQHLKKTRRAKHITRIEALERRVEAMAALVVKG